MPETRKLVVSTARVADILNLDVTDSRVEFANKVATSYCEHIAGREIFLQERTIVVDGNGRPWMYLPVCPLASVSSIKVSQARDWNNVPALDFGSYFLQFGSAGVELYSGVFPRGRSNIQIVYTAGYDTDAFPEDIEKGIIECVSSYMRKINDKAWGIKTINQSDGTNLVYDFDEPISAKYAFEGLKQPRF